ncbi:MAG TPA: hypothetical protein VI564_04255 [Candidatus Nanoarchaeia archaeon]|nr:hypothetical protein [Candidatus Nanoarchaeia archaeon]
MKTKENAILVLGHIYDIDIEQGDEVRQSKLLEVTKLNEKELTNALNYLIRMYMIEGEKLLDGEFITINITELGVSIVENKDQFKRNFGIEIGIPGVISTHWGVEQK